MRFKRMVAMVLTISIIMGAMPIQSVFGEDAQRIQYLESVKMDPKDLASASVIYMGTAAAEVQEAGGKYAVKIFREGDATQKATVEVKTIDLTAIYGKDYRITAGGSIQVIGGDISLMEQLAKAELEGAATPTDVPEEEEIPENKIDEEKIVAVATPTNLAGTLPTLAQMKQQQTGLPTRETSETEMTMLSDAFLSQLAPEIGNVMDASSITTVRFAEGETEKTIIFEILDDGESEGTEGFSMILANPTGSEVYGITATAISIRDDEAVVRSEISFARSAYQSADGTVAIDIVREGAEYSMADVTFHTENGSAVANENFVAQMGTVLFMPYETEKTVELQVSGDGEFFVELDNFRGAQEGDITRARARINEPIAPLAGAEQKQSFNIKISGKGYTVEYLKGDATGKIMDMAYNPPLEVGTYYFAADEKRGGNFYYQIWGGDEVTDAGWRHSYYDYKSSRAQNENYGKIQYYSTLTRHTGSAAAATIDKLPIPSDYYQYVVPDWLSERDDYGRQEFRFIMKDEKFKWISEVDAFEKFDRTQDNASLQIKNLDGKGLHFKVMARDTQENHTPIVNLQFFGLAFMYKTFHVTTQPGAQLTYEYNGGKVTAAPAQVSTASGAHDPYDQDARYVYANLDEKQSNIVFDVKETMVSGNNGIFGDVTGYTITLDSATVADRVTLQYPSEFLEFVRVKYPQSEYDNVRAKVNADLRRIPCDPYFINWIETSANGKVANQGKGYYYEMKFLPKMGYRNVKVRVSDTINPGEAKFNDTRLAKDKTVTFHAGDTLDLSATVSNPDKKKVVGYQVSTDGGVSYTTYSVGKSLFLEHIEDGRYYDIRPVVADKDNSIEIRYTKKALENLKVLNLIPQEDLSADLKGRHLININPTSATAADKMEPTVGEAYQIKMLITGKPSNSKMVYRPKISVKAPAKTYRTLCLDYVAKGETADNVITIDVEEVLESDMTYFSLDGTLISDFKPIRDSGVQWQNFPVEAYGVFVGGEQQQSYDTSADRVLHFVNRVEGKTDEHGNYRMDGIYAASGDLTTMLVTNGAATQVVDVKLSKDGLTAEKIPHNYSRANVATKKTESGTEEVQGYVMAEFIVKLLYPSNLPKVTSVMYTYEKEESQGDADETSNVVRMFDDTLLLTATINAKDRHITKAIFTVVTAAGTRTTYTAPEDTSDPNVYKAKIPKMLDNLFNGDKIFVRLVDAEKKEMTVSSAEIHPDGTVDENVPSQSAFLDIEYPDVDTGLMTYIENELVRPQTYDVEQLKPVNVPLLGNTTGKSKTGLITFDKTMWPDNSGYTLTFNADFLWSTGKNPTVQERKQIFDDFGKQIQGLEKARQDTQEGIEYVKTTEAKILAQSDLTEEQAKARENDLNAAIKDANNVLKKKNQAVAAGYSTSKFSIDVIFLMLFEFVYNPEYGTFDFLGGTVAAGGTFNYTKMFYSIIVYVPVYMQLSGTLQVDFPLAYTVDGIKNSMTSGDFEGYSGNLANRLETTTSGGMVIMLGGKIAVGVGLCGVIGARGYAQARMQGSAIATDGMWNEGASGFLFNLNGGMAVDLLITSIELQLANVGYGEGIYANQTQFNFFGGLKDGPSIKSARANTPTGSATDLPTGERLVVRDYKTGTSDMSGFGKKANFVTTSTPEEVRKSVLLDDANERTRPRIISLADGRKFIIFIANKSGRDAINSPCLMYSICDTQGNWSTPLPVADDGTPDTTPSITYYGNKVAITWADANRALTSADSPKDKLNSFGISYAIFDVPSGTMGTKQVLVDDHLLNQSPKIVVDAVNGSIYCFYMKRDLTNAESVEALADISGLYSTMAYKVHNFNSGLNDNTEYFIAIDHENMTDPLVFDYQVETLMVNGTPYVVSAYTIDEDQNLSTAEDREIYLNVYDAQNKQNFHHIRLTNDEISQSVPQLNLLNDELILSWVSDGYLFDFLNVSKMLKAFAEKPVYFASAPTDRQWYKKTAAQLGMSDDKYAGSVYAEAAAGEFDTQETNLLQNEDLQSAISAYKLITDGKDIFVFYTDFADGRMDNGDIELYGAAYTRSPANGATDADSNQYDWGWGTAVKVTDFGKVIDEFDLTVDSNGQFSMVSNFYEQTVGANGGITFGDNQLVEIDFDNTSSIAALKDSILFPSQMVPGTVEKLEFTVQNRGLVRAQGYDVLVKQVVNGVESMIDQFTVQQLLMSGETAEHSILWTIPENLAGTSIVIEVREHGAAGLPISVSTDIPLYSKLDMALFTAECTKDDASIEIVLKNKGNQPTKPGQMSVYHDNGADDGGQKKYASFNVPALAPGESQTFQSEIDIVAEDFDDKGRVSLRAEVISRGEVAVDGRTSVNISKPARVTLNNGVDSMSMTGGESQQLTAYVAPWERIAGEVRFATADKSIVNISPDGKMVAVGNGTTTVYAYYPLLGIYDEMTVTVSGAVDPKPEPRPSGGGGGTLSNQPPDGAEIPTEVPTDPQPLFPDAEAVENTLPFTDVDPGDWFYDSVKKAYESGLMFGMNDTSFGADTSLTRGMLVTILARAAGVAPTDNQSSYTDVADTSMYYVPYVAWAEEEGIVQGFGDGTFRPNLPVTREQMAVIFAKYQAMLGDEITPEALAGAEMPYADADEIASWARDSVLACTQKGLLRGKGNSLFDPKAETTRAEAATVLVKLAEQTALTKRPVFSADLMEIYTDARQQLAG